MGRPSGEARGLSYWLDANDAIRLMTMIEEGEPRRQPERQRKKRAALRPG
jgi:hypothetical protein